MSFFVLKNQIFYCLWYCNGVIIIAITITITITIIITAII